jgi:hypothetical protein
MWLVAAGCLVVVIVFLWRAAEWQNSIRTVMKMAPVETAHPFKVCAIALVTFAALLLLGRLFALVSRVLARAREAHHSTQGRERHWRGGCSAAVLVDCQQCPDQHCIWRARFVLP